MSTLLKNSDGKILRNSGGSVLKQNYNFGRSTTVHPNIQFPAIFNNAYDDISIVWISKHTNQVTDPIGWFSFPSSSYESALTVAGRAQSVYWHADKVLNTDYNYLNKLVSSSITAGVFGFSHHLFSVLNNVQQVVHAKCVLGNLTYSSDTNILYTPTTENFISLIVGISGKNNKSFEKHDSLSNPINELFVFSRSVSGNELQFMNNNGLGNNPQNVSGLELWAKFGLAEVINGVASIRDRSGNNRHGEIINAPAGTAQEKVDYYNKNWTQL